MRTYNLELRHAPSKRRLNACANNRLEPLKARLAGDGEAITWARGELMDFARHARGEAYNYVEAAVMELLPFADVRGDKDQRRLGRWVCNADGIIWRDAQAAAA